MNYTNLRKWLEDLRTTSEPQTTGVLHDDTGFCCLGRACEVALPDLPNMEVTQPSFTSKWRYDWETTTLPPSVLQWLGVHRENCLTPYCVTMNDRYGMTFVEIADRIEKAYPIPFEFLDEPYRTRVIALYDALRSGDFKQGRHVLNSFGLLCCLGVACEIAYKDIPLVRADCDRFVYYNERSAMLPPEAMNYYGFADRAGAYGANHSLTDDNDTLGKTFAEIAEIMATTPDLFTDAARGVPMDEQIAKVARLTPEQAQWVFALSNGLYDQGRGKLCRIDRDGQSKKYCCLGVACDLAKEAGIPLLVSEHSEIVRFDCEPNYMPLSVNEWTNLKSSYGWFGAGSLAGMNDEGADFVEIAQTILDNSDTLFST